MPTPPRAQAPTDRNDAFLFFGLACGVTWLLDLPMAFAWATHSPPAREQDVRAACNAVPPLAIARHAGAKQMLEKRPNAARAAAAPVVTRATRAGGWRTSLLLLDCRLAPDGHAPVPVVVVPRTSGTCCLACRNLPRAVGSLRADPCDRPRSLAASAARRPASRLWDQRERGRGRRLRFGRDQRGDRRRIDRKR